MKTLSLLLLLLLTGCATRTPLPDPALIQQRTLLCQQVWQEELGREIDPTGLKGCLLALDNGGTAAAQRTVLQESAEYRERQIRLSQPDAGERGVITRERTRLVADGKTWRSRGFSDFKLFQKFLDGEDIDALLTERIKVGANELRVFGMFDGGIGRFHPEDYANYWLGLERFITKLDSRGLRIEFVVFADAQRIIPTIPAQQHHLEEVGLVLNAHWNARGELVNEWPQNGIDPTHFGRPPGPTLWSRGSNLSDFPPYSPAWDYITDHPGRNNEWPRKVEARPITDAYDRPTSENEPIGAAELDSPGRRSASPDDFASLGGLCALWASGGCTFHSDAGVLSEPLGPIQLLSAHAFFAALSFAPPDAPFWPYQRGDANSLTGIGNMPIDHFDSPNPLGALRTACRSNGPEEWCVAVRPGPGWVAHARDGWTVDWQRGPRGSLIHLSK